MKTKILTGLLSFLLNTICLAQIAVSDLRQIKNVAQYKAGKEALLKHFVKSLRNPMAVRKAPAEVCAILGVIKVSKNGAIKEIGTLNKVPKPFKDEFIKVAKLTDGNWMPTNDTADFFYSIIPIVFNNEAERYSADFNNPPKFFNELVVVVVYSPTNVYYKEDSKYLEKVNEAVAKGKYQKAVETMEFLLRRQPLNTDYYRKIIALNTELGKKEEIDYYTALLKVIANPN